MELNELIENYRNTKTTLHKELVNRIKEMVSKFADNRLVFEEIDPDYRDFSYASISYDGGNHPEYASNCYSELQGAFIKNDTLYFMIEDCDEYNVDRVWSIEELIDAYNVIEDFFKL